MNSILLSHIETLGSKFKVSFSMSGLAMEQMELYAPEVLDSFRKLVATGQVEILAETYGHSLSSLRDKEEFREQVASHSRKIQDTFGLTPTAFRNTELIYSDQIGADVAEMGFRVMLTEGAKHVLGWKSPNFMYANAINPKLKVLLRNFRLSDDIAFRFGMQSWAEWPLTVEKFAGWLNNLNPKEEVVNLFMDYETFGEHQWAATGIFDFMKKLPATILAGGQYQFATPSELAEKLQPVSAIHVPYPISWADEERDVTAWLGNNMQDEVFALLYSLKDKMRNISNPALQRDWQYLQASDHFYYMCTKWFSDGVVHKYFNHYASPYEAYINFMNVLADFTIRVNEAAAEVPSPEQELRQTGEALLNLGVSLGKTALTQVRKAARQIEDTVKRKEEELKPALEDIVRMSDAKIKKLVKELETDDLLAALNEAGDELVNKVLPNMSKKAREAFERARAEAGRISKTRSREARKKVEEKMKEFLG
jgi:alpha-amylase